MSTLSEPLWRTAERADICLWLFAQHPVTFGHCAEDFRDLISIVLISRRHAKFGGDRWTCLSSATK